MHIASRIFLFLAAALWAGYVAMEGMAFSRNVEPELHSASSIASWIVFGAIAAVPFWAPAVVPVRFPRTLKVARFFGAAGAIALIFLFAWSSFGSIIRLVSGFGIDNSLETFGLLLTATCIVALALLVWPGPRGVPRRRA